MKILVVVDMQNDFVTDALRNEMGISIVKNVKDKILEELDKNTLVIFTRDTHDANYLNTEEGKNLPVVHCIKNTFGWEIIDEIKPYAKNIIDKPIFGSLELANELKRYKDVSEVELIGLCTDICVISNALIAKAALPNAHISLDASCCAGVTLKSHLTALEALKSCHVEIKNENKEPYRKGE